MRRPDTSITNSQILRGSKKSEWSVATGRQQWVNDKDQREEETQRVDKFAVRDCIAHKPAELIPFRQDRREHNSESRPRTGDPR